MITIKSSVYFDESVPDMNIYSVDEFADMIYDLDMVETLKGGRGKLYLSKVATFDIECCTVPYQDTYVAYMYHWQFALFDEYHVIMGTTWKEYRKLIQCINQLYPGKILVVYVHNLGYEAQFLRTEHKVIEAFCVDEHSPIRLLTENNIEYRCSYKLSNMSLDKFCEKSGVKYRKQTGKYDYTKIRLPSDPVPESDLVYDYCDVAGLIECINKRLEDHDVLNIPLTSTGYVRQNMRDALAKDAKRNRAYFLRGKIDSDVYTLCKKARRGGNTHASGYYSGQIVANVRSRDKKSSYPYEMCTKLYPLALRMEDTTNFDWHIERGRFVVFTAVFEKIRLKRGIEPVPYISVAKCEIKRRIAADNGRLISGDFIVVSLTEIDYKIICNQYIWDAMRVAEMAVGEGDMLPHDFRDEIMCYFAQKEELTGKDEYLRDRKKNEINAIFGMLLTDIVHDKIIYNNNGDDMYARQKLERIDTELERYFRSYKNFCIYQQGIYVTAYARQSLQEGLDITGIDTIYTDTDSDKYIGDHEKEFEEINDRIRGEAESFDVKPYLDGGIYLGVWEDEGTYDHFATCGAKKYGYDIDGKIKTTIAGCNKKTGAEYIAEHYGLQAFTDALSAKVVVDEEHSGRLTAYYHDWDKHITIKVGGEEIRVGSNVAMVPTTYSLGVTTEYEDYLASIKKGYDFL